MRIRGNTSSMHTRVPHFAAIADAVKLKVKMSGWKLATRHAHEISDQVI